MTTAWCRCLLMRTILEPFHIHQGLIFAVVQFSNVQFTLCNACFADEYTLVTTAGHRPLRSADNQTCLVKRSCNEISDHCFASTWPALWNNLPEHLRQPDVAFNDSSDR